MYFKLRLIFLAMAMVHAATSFAQRVDSWKKTPADREECRKFKNNIFFSFNYTPVAGGVKRVFNYVNVSENGRDTMGTQYIDDMISIFIAEFDIRYNFLNVRDWMSVSLAAKPGLSVLGGSDIMMLFTPAVGIDVNLWSHSTFNNIDNYGLSLGFGKQFYFHYYSYVTTDPSWSEYYGRVTFKFRKSRYNPLKKLLQNSSVGFQYGFSNTHEITRYNLPSNTINTSWRIIIGKILWY